MDRDKIDHEAPPTELPAGPSFHLGGTAHHLSTSKRPGAPLASAGRALASAPAFQTGGKGGSNHGSGTKNRSTGAALSMTPHLKHGHTQAGFGVGVDNIAWLSCDLTG